MLQSLARAPSQVHVSTACDRHRSYVAASIAITALSSSAASSSRQGRRLVEGVVVNVVIAWARQVANITSCSSSAQDPLPHASPCRFCPDLDYIFLQI
jgi:hypothetical protein